MTQHRCPSVAVPKKNRRAGIEPCPAGRRPSAPQTAGNDAIRPGGIFSKPDGRNGN